MTSEQLVEAIKNKKLSTYEYLKYLSEASREDLNNSGYRKYNNAEAVLLNLKRAEDEIEQMIVKFEKENPI